LNLPGLKVHSKVALITRQRDNQRILYGYYGTGNFNENTARIYADEGLLTTHPGMNGELNDLFKFLITSRKIKVLQHLLISQFNLREKFIERIDREIKHARQGKQGSMILKMNNLEDTVMIEKLYEASGEGVKIDLIIRGICCLRPGIKGLSENITITRLVDRYLEHARIFYFFNDGEEEIYLASADWMKRNLYRRIEVGFPLLDKHHIKRIKFMLELQLSDNVKAARLASDHTHVLERSARKMKSIRAQEDFYHYLRNEV